MTAILLSNQGFVLVARLLVASVFVMAGAAKLPQRQTFADDIRQYRLLPNALARGYAFVLPWIELLVAASLFSGVLARAGAGLALLLLFSFLVAVGSAIARHLNLNCQCFGLLYRERVGSATLARDGILALLAAEVAVFGSGRFALPAVVAGLPRPSDVSALVCTIVVFAASSTAALIAIRPPRGTDVAAVRSPAISAQSDPVAAVASADGRSLLRP